jgi:acetolactate synthase I/III small subunit
MSQDDTPIFKSLRTFIAYLDDRPGVLNRVASLFRRRGYNIASLNVGRTHEAGISRMTLVAEADEAAGQRMEANLYKLIDVLSVEDISEEKAVVRDLALIKVRGDEAARARARSLCDAYRAEVADASEDTVIFAITASPERIVQLVEALRPTGIVEMVQTGSVAMTRGQEGHATRVAHGADALTHARA